MGIVGFEFTRLHAEKTAPARGKIGVKNNVSFKDVQEITLSLGKNDSKGVKFSFSFSTVYEPKIGIMELDGAVLFVDEEKIIKDVLERWKKDKAVKKEVSVRIINHILEKSNIEALLLARELHLPSPVQLPKVEVKDKPAPKK